jgi:uncharacterized protein (DUF1697 family)
MEKYVAFLRAINVGGHVVKMDHLRRLVAGVGVANVETFIASGNVIFDASTRSTSALEKKIESALHTALGYEVATFIRPTSAVAEVAAYQPFPDVDAPGNMLYVGFLSASPTSAAERALVACSSSIDEFHLAGRELFWLCRKTFRESDFNGARIEKLLGVKATLRNITTVRRLAAKYT